MVSVIFILYNFLTKQHELGYLQTMSLNIQIIPQLYIIK
jgi:hypothetical protein